MTRPATWKVVTVGAALTGLGMLGAGAANAATLPAPAPTAVGITLDWSPEIVDVIALDDDWTETYWDDSWGGHRGGDHWTETYWDD